MTFIMRCHTAIGVHLKFWLGQQAIKSKSTQDYLKNVVYSSTLQKSEIFTTYFDGERGIVMRYPLLPFSIESLHKPLYRYELFKKKLLSFTFLDPLILILSNTIMISSLISLQLCRYKYFFSVMASALVL